MVSLTWVLQFCVYLTIAIQIITKPKIKRKIHAQVTSADASHVGPLGMVLCSIRLGLCIFQDYLKVCQNVLHVVILGRDFAKCFSRNRLEWLWTTILVSRP